MSDAHRAARREQILDAAARCFGRQGFHRTAMTDIIAEAGLSPGAIYSYFPSKRALIAAIAEARHARETALLSRALEEEDPRAALHALTRGYFGWLAAPAERRQRRLTVQLWAEALRDRRVATVMKRGLAQRELMVELFRRARRKGQLPRGADPDALSRVMLALAQGFVLQQAWEPGADADGYAAALEVLIDALLCGDDRAGRARPRRPRPVGSRRPRRKGTLPSAVGRS